MKRSCCNGLAAIALLGGVQSAAANVISDWNERVIEFTVDRKMPPPAAERLIAMVQVSMFDAVNSIDRKYRPYLVQLPTEAAAATAYANLDVSSLIMAAATAAASLLAPAPTVEVPT